MKHNEFAGLIGPGESRFAAIYYGLAPSHPDYRAEYARVERRMMYSTPRELVQALRIGVADGTIVEVCGLGGFDAPSQAYLAAVEESRRVAAQQARDAQLVGVVTSAVRDGEGLLLTYADGRHLRVQGWDDCEFEVQVEVVDASPKQA